MKVNFAQTLLNYDGSEIVTGSQQECPACKHVEIIPGDALTLRAVAMRVLGSSDKELKAEDSIHRGMLSYQIFGNDELDMVAKDITLIQVGLPKAYSPLIVLQAHALLEGKENPIKTGN